jgi:hypothetical protein
VLKLSPPSERVRGGSYETYWRAVSGLAAAGHRQRRRSPALQDRRHT